MRILRSVPFLLLLALPTQGRADSWLPFRDFRVVSPDGGTYAVVRADEGSARFEIRTRREGAPPLGPAFATDEYGMREGEGGPIDADPADPLIARGVFGQLPLEARVLDGGRGLLFVENYGMVGYEVSLAFVDASGAFAFQHKLRDLFDAATIEDFTHTVSSIWWKHGVLVDDENLRALVVAHGDRLLAVSLADGKVSQAKPEDLLRHFWVGTEEERALALEVAGRLRPDGLAGAARVLAEGEAMPLGIRFRAAVALKRITGETLLAVPFREAVEEGHPPELRKYATSHLAEMLGADALPVLRALMRGPADGDVWHPAQTGFVSLGEAAVPTLIEMLLEEGESPDYRGGAAHALGRIGSKSAVDALLRATATAEDYVANAAVNAAIAIGAEDLGVRLAAILLEGSTQDGRIASWFEDHPAEYAREPLEAALARAAPDSYEQRAIQAALDALDKR
ncbi:MAG: HEAT repeat domain-containing protein [Planctomycetota bacterium]|jgi:HEAT repeat protein